MDWQKKIFKRKKNGDFVRRKQYRLAIINLSSLSTVFQIKVGRWQLWVGGIALFVLLGILWLLAYLYTPLRNILPLRLQADLRDEYVDLSMRIDSLQSVARLNDQYANNILRILGDSAEMDRAAVEAVGSLPQTLPLDSLLEASQAERSFVSRFEDAERYNLSVLSPIAAEGMTFYPMVTGAEPEARVSEMGIPYIIVVPTKTMPVSAIYRGTVVNTYFTTGKGITVSVQHPNDFISIYTGLSETFVARGEKVTAGTRLGLATAGRYPLQFELWHNGAPLPPLDYIMVP